jgi:uncharacterized membrane protein SpoIIM required for sporulation
VKVLSAFLLDLIAEGHGHRAVKLQIVSNGITLAQDIGVSIGDPADSEVVWVYGVGAVELPAWFLIGGAGV